MKTTIAATALAVLLPLTACSSPTTSTSSPSAGATGANGSAAASGTITVLAAASLKESFDQIADAYRTAHPGVTLRISYGGSSALAQQVVQGAPVDLFAAASTTTMKTAAASGRMDNPVTFATNRLEVAVPAANPAHVTQLADLAKSTVKVALCQTTVPCGAAATTTLARAHLTVRPVTLEPDVKSVLTKVSLGEVDAGLVYVTDVKAAGDKVTGIPIPAAQNTVTSYPMAVVKDGPNAAAARAFEAFVASATGRAVLAAHGFGRP